VERLITIVSGVVATFVLVDWPEDTKFLTKAEKELLASRLREDLQEVKMDRMDLAAMKRILSDWKLHCA
jgi:hypothetical protein